MSSYRPHRPCVRSRESDLAASEKIEHKVNRNISIHEVSRVCLVRQRVLLRPLPGLEFRPAAARRSLALTRSTVKTCYDSSDDTFLVLQGQVDVRQGDTRKPLITGQAAFVPSGQIHGTITTGTGTTILISFQCPPDYAL